MNPNEENVYFPELVTIFPPENQGDLAEFPPVAVAKRDVARLSSLRKCDEEVNVFFDEEVEDQVVELLGKHCNLGFALENVDLRFLVLQLKNVERFFTLDFIILGEDVSLEIDQEL